MVVWKYVSELDQRLLFHFQITVKSSTTAQQPVFLMIYLCALHFSLNPSSYQCTWKETVAAEEGEKQLWRELLLICFSLHVTLRVAASRSQRCGMGKHTPVVRLRSLSLPVHSPAHSAHAGGCQTDGTAHIIKNNFFILYIDYLFYYYLRYIVFYVRIDSVPCLSSVCLPPTLSSLTCIFTNILLVTTGDQ